MSNKTGKILNYIYDRLILIVFILLLLFSCYLTYDTWYVRYVSAGNNYLAYKPSLEEPEAYKELGEECIGWIAIDDTSIDYPIMQSKDNSKYLNTNPYGEYSLAGSIFLDFKNKPDFSDSYNLIYGHHMSMRTKDGKNSMFGCLDLFWEEQYFNTHKTGKLTADKTIHDLDVFAIIITDANESLLFDTNYQEGQYEFIKENAKFFREPKDKKRIVALSTCKDPGTTERTIVFCMIKEK